MRTKRIMSGSIGTPLGRLHVVWAEAGGDVSRLCGASFSGQRRLLETFLARHGLVATGRIRPGAGVPTHLRAPFERYFAGEIGALRDVPTLEVGTAFQAAVWRALREIPAGETRSYGEIARVVGRPRSFRAVGGANGTNPIAIATPCHRVIGSDGSLTGYGGGMRRKEWLLAHERTAAARRRGTPR